MFGNAKEGLFRELANAQNISFDELEKIHQEFIRATSYRGDSSGRVDFNEFQQLLKSRINNSKTIQELFHAVDVEKSGAIDFRNFIVSMCVLRSGSFEQRLWFAFRAYDADGSNTIDKNEMYSLLRSAFEAKGGFVNDGAIWDQINRTFSMFFKVKIYFYLNFIYSSTTANKFSCLLKPKKPHFTATKYSFLWQ